MISSKDLQQVFSPYPGPSEVSRGGRGGRGLFAAEVEQ